MEQEASSPPPMLAWFSETVEGQHLATAVEASCSIKRACDRESHQ